MESAEHNRYVVSLAKVLWKNGSTAEAIGLLDSHAREQSARSEDWRAAFVESALVAPRPPSDCALLRRRLTKQAHEEDLGHADAQKALLVLAKAQVPRTAPHRLRPEFPRIGVLADSDLPPDLNVYPVSRIGGWPTRFAISYAEAFASASP